MCFLACGMMKFYFLEYTLLFVMHYLFLEKNFHVILFNKKILRKCRYPINHRLSDIDKSTLMMALYFHPRRDEKLGSGAQDIKVRKCWTKNSIISKVLGGLLVMKHGWTQHTDTCKVICQNIGEETVAKANIYIYIQTRTTLTN